MEAKISSDISNSIFTEQMNVSLNWTRPVYKPLTVFRVASGYSYTLSSCCEGWVLDKHGEVLVSRAEGMPAVLVITEQKLQHKTSVSDRSEVEKLGSGLCLLHHEGKWEGCSVRQPWVLTDYIL